MYRFSSFFKVFRGHRILALIGLTLFLWNLHFIYSCLDSRKVIPNSKKHAEGRWDRNRLQRLFFGPTQPVAKVQQTFPCNITGEVAIKALKRAKTEKCREKIENVVCKLQQGSLFPQRLERTCPLRDSANARKYVGCFSDDSSNRLLRGASLKFPESNSPIECTDACLQLGFQLAGVEFRTECFCGSLDSISDAERQTDIHCDRFKCPGGEKQACGGYNSIAIFNSGLGTSHHKSTSYAKLDGGVVGREYSGPRVVFLLQLNGRASRQNNFRVKQSRFATIWGGASLLDMILDSIKDLISLWPEPSWDFLLNLSEADFPILSMEELEKLLDKNRGFNFLRSHGNNTLKFISKQGLDKVFVECEQRMWRVGERKLPRGIRIDGGSDWVCLDREFATYAATSNGELAKSLRELFKFTLLPAESFFHVLAANTKFCSRVINSNLKLTNWRRKQGCKCQYKHIVDWCGCSPSVFNKNPDWTKLSRPGVEKRLHYFARKFEPIIDQSVVALAEKQSSRSVVEKDDVFDAYWQNEFDWLDRRPKPNSALLMLMRTLGHAAYDKLKLTDCGRGCRFGNATEMNLYKASDRGEIELLVKIPVICDNFNTGSEFTIEIFASRKHPWKQFIEVPGYKLNSMEVSGLFDLKEQIFRNYHGSLGQRGPNPTLRHSWEFEVAARKLDAQVVWVNVVWIDPDGSEYSTSDPAQELKAEARIYHSVLDLESLDMDLTPGVWTAKILRNSETVAQTKFGIFPDKTGNEQLANKLVQEFYSVRNVCKVGTKDSDRVARVRGEVCEALYSLPNCAQMKWSSMFSDKKADINFGYDQKLRQLV